jgi:hypothetical protein
MANNENTTSGHNAFCLRRAGHTDDLVRDFGQMLEDEELVDVTLSCEDGSMNVHRMFLAANSTYFKSLFARLATSVNKSQYPVIILKDVSFADLKAIVEFIYRGEVTIPQAQLQSVLRAADGMKIRGLNGSDVPTDVTASGKKKKRKKRKKRSSKAGSSDDGEEGGDGGSAGNSGSNGNNSDNNNEEGSGNDMMSDDDEDEESIDYSRTHITPVNDDCRSSIDDLEPSRLLEQTMTITGKAFKTNQNMHFLEYFVLSRLICITFRVETKFQIV